MHLIKPFRYIYDPVIPIREYFHNLPGLNFSACFLEKSIYMYDKLIVYVLFIGPSVKFWKHLHV